MCIFVVYIDYKPQHFMSIFTWVGQFCIKEYFYASLLCVISLKLFSGFFYRFINVLLFIYLFDSHFFPFVFPSSQLQTFPADRKAPNVKTTSFIRSTLRSLFLTKDLQREVEGELEREGAREKRERDLKTKKAKQKKNTE